MNKKFPNTVLAALAGVFMTPSILVQAAEAPARAWLDQAQETAQSWQTDAVLSSVSTTVLKQDGTALVWTYSYVSPATVTCARVIMVGGGEPRLQNLGHCAPAKAISMDFVDSPIMIKAAMSAGFKPGETSDAYLSVKQDRAVPERECWVVHTIADFDKEKAVMRGWCVDPESGEFVIRLSGESGPYKP
jgi:hypothetical protein